MKEHVATSPRSWRTGTISQDVPPHGQCQKCGGPIWFGKVQFKGKDKPSWIVYSEAGHGGGGAMVMEKHDCNKPAHSGRTMSETAMVPPTHQKGFSSRH